MGKINTNWSKVELQRMKAWMDKVEKRIDEVEKESENVGDFKYVHKSSIYRFYLEETINKFNCLTNIK